MKFGYINPKDRTATIIEHHSLQDAMKIANLEGGSVDFGTVVRGLGVVVYEFGLFVPAQDQHYFGLGGRLWAGNAVLYAYDEGGETIDLPKIDHPIVWYNDVADVELSIINGGVVRPGMFVNGKMIWRWPDPPPSGMAPGSRKWDQ